MARLTRFLLVMVLFVPALIMPATRNAASSSRGLLQPTLTSETIDFDDLVTAPVDGTDHLKVFHQYDSKHVRFNRPVLVDYGTDGPDADFPRSGPNAIQPCFTGAPCDEPLTLTFSRPQALVRVWVGVFGNLTAPAKVTMTAFDGQENSQEVGSISLTLLPVEGEHIPIDTPLEVSTFSYVNTISRVVVEVSPADTPGLAFDDITFAASENAETPDGGEIEPTCPDGALPPNVVVTAPPKALQTQVNTFIVRGTAVGTAPVTAATLTTQGPGGLKSMALPRDLFDPVDPSFAFTVDDLLLPGSNGVTLALDTCAGQTPVTMDITYDPIEEAVRYRVLGVEVTQAIQNLDNTVPLVAGKRTYIRVYLQALGTTKDLKAVSGSLPVCRLRSADPPACEGRVVRGEVLHSDENNVVNELDNVSRKRQGLDESLDFALPLELSDAGRLWLDISNLTLSPAYACENCADFASADGLLPVDFQEQPPLQIEIVDVAYMLDGVLQRPTSLDRKRLQSWLERAYPTAEVEFLTDLKVIVASNKTPTCAEINQRMFDDWVKISDLNTAEALEESPIRFYALVRHPGKAVLGYAGCAAAEKNPVLGEDDTPIAARRFATGVAGSGDPYAWDTDGSFADFYGGHELGHLYGQMHVGQCEAEGDVDPTYKPQDGRISESAEFGFDVGDASQSGYPRPDPIAMTSYDPVTHYDVMSYCPDRWISAHTYKSLIGNLPEEETALETPDVVFALATPPAGVILPPATPAAGFGASQDVLTVLGTIHLPPNGTPTVDLLPFSRLPGAAVTPRNPNGSYRIVLEDLNGTPQASYAFEPALYTDMPANAPAAQLSEVVPWVENTARIVIYAGAQEIGSRKVSRHDPQVTITVPNGGELLSSPATTVTWDASDDDPDDVLTFTLLYSTDRGATWQSVASGLQERRYTVDLAELPGSAAAIFRVIATDGVNTGQDDSDGTFQVPNNAPDADIVAPPDGTEYGPSHTIVLVGRASDVEQGDLDDTSLHWMSNLDGALGTGRSISATSLTPGIHTITLTATDAANAAGSTTISIEIRDDDTLPVVTWDPARDISILPDGLFFYGGGAQRAEIYSTDGGGNLQMLNTFFTFLDGWTAIVPGHFNGEDALTDLFFYAAETGLSEFYTSDGEGGLRLLSSNTDVPSTGWDMVVPGDFGGDDAWTDLFFYDRETDSGRFYISDGDGQLQPLGSAISFDREWSIIVPGNFGGDDRTDLLTYNAEAGLSRFFSSDGQGNLTLLQEDPNWTTGWDHIVAGDFDGEGDWTDLFFTREEVSKGGATREYKFYTTDGQGDIYPLGQPGQMEPTWTIMLSGNFDGADPITDLFLYDAASGRRRFLQTDGSGDLEELNRSDAGATGWEIIVPGRYTGASPAPETPEPDSPPASATPAP